MSRDKRSGSLWSLRCAINACLGAILGAVAFIALCPALTDASAVAQQQKPAGCDPLPVRKKFDTTPPINIGLLTDELIYYRCTDYDTDVANTLAQARAWGQNVLPRCPRQPSSSTSTKHRFPIGTRSITTSSPTFPRERATSNQHQPADNAHGS